MNLYDWIESRVPGGHHSRLGSFIDVAYNIEYGDETSRQRRATEPPRPPRLPDRRRVLDLRRLRRALEDPGGNQQITLAQADFLGSQNTALGWSFTSLKANHDGHGDRDAFNVGSGPSQTVTARPDHPRIPRSA